MSRIPRRSSLQSLASLLLLAPVMMLAPGCGPATAPPQSRDPGAITVEGALSSSLVLTGGDRTVYARIRIATVPRPAAPRGPVNVALAIDTSGSMEGASIDEARRAAERLVDALKDGDFLAVVVFHSKAEVLVPSTEVSAEVRAEAKRHIRAIVASGTTEMAGGLDTALHEARVHMQSQGVNRVVLLGDGIPNRAAGLESMAAAASQNGIAITTLGLGLDYDETLMGKIAQISGGHFQYVESADKMAGFFQEELDRLDSVYGRRAYARFSPGPGVRIESVVGSSSASPGTGAVMTLGDIARGDSRDIMVRMTVTPRRAGVPIELLDVVVSFEDALVEAGQLERHVFLGAHTTESEAEATKATIPSVELSAALAEASATMLEALELGKKGLYTRARELLTKGALNAMVQSRKTPSKELDQLITNMNAVASDMPLADKPQPAPRAPEPSSGYEFQDDALQAAPAESVPPDVARKRKSAHQFAFDQLQ